MAFPDEITQTIRGVCRPLAIILYGEKRTLSTDKHALQHTLYLAIVADVPVNLTLYTVQEWDALTEDETSYAAWIRRKGRVLYEQGA